MTNLFYTHEPDNRIMVKKDMAEARNWGDMLESFNTELDYMMKVEGTYLKDSRLYHQLHAFRRENTLKSAAIFRYENSIRNAIECDSMECDAYYLHKHEKHRQLYVDHTREFAELRHKVLEKVLVRSQKTTQ